MPKILGAIKGELWPLAYLAFQTCEQAVVALQAINGIYIRHQHIKVWRVRQWQGGRQSAPDEG